MEAMVELVRGKAHTPVPAAHVRETASKFREVSIDVGTGDGRWAYRMARAHPERFCLGIDANAAGLRDVSFRASRKPSRGGVSNVWFIRAAVETLPAGLEHLADHITIFYPWRRLLDGILKPDPAVIRPIGLLGKHGAQILICINESALHPGTHAAGPVACSALLARLRAPYAEAGIALTTCRIASGPGTTWGDRVGQGRPARSVVVTGVVRGEGCEDSTVTGPL
ncbi:MAG TPA: class I SAM-dependent methyltransferase [bacterium]|nr:class I SAM-dependent methyltransferase [bacterium]